MEGKFQYRLPQWLLFWTAVFALVQPSFAEAPPVSTDQKLATAKLLLGQIEKGAPPCYSPECQDQKAELIDLIVRQSSRLGFYESDFMSSREAGVLSARALIHHPFPSPNLNPQTLEDWKAWWLNRYSFEERLRSDWTRFFGEITTEERALSLYRALLQANPSAKTIFAEAWDRGIGEAASLLRETSRLSEAAARNPEQRVKLRRRAQENLRKVKKFDEDFGVPSKLLIERILPQTDFLDAANLLVRLQRWFPNLSGEAIFSKDVSEILLSNREELKYLIKLISAFDHREYGIIGIANFYSPVNTLVAAESEYIIQSFLDQVDSQAKILISLGAFMTMMQVGEVVVGSGLLARFGLPSFMAYYSLKGEKDLMQSWLWPSATRTEFLARRMPQLDKQMHNRRDALLRTRNVLRNRIQEYEYELETNRNEGIL